MKPLLLKRYSFPSLVWIISVPAVITLFLLITSINDVTVLQTLLAFALALIAWQSYVAWRKTSRDDFPLFSLISAMYFLYYGVPIFWGDSNVMIDSDTYLHVPTEALTQGLILATAGVAALWLGIRTRIGSKHAPKRVFEITMRSTRMNYVRIVLVIGSLLSSSDLSLYALGQGGRQAMSILISTIPLLAFAILFRAYLRKEATQFDRVLIAGFLIVRFLSGMSSGWLGSFTSILVICAALYLSERKRLPRMAMIVVIAFTLFFQVGKEDFRKNYWVDREPPASRIERLVFWIDTSFSKWNDAVSNPSTERLRDTISPSVNRLALLNQTANVIDKTPRVVSYQYGKLYYYMLVSLIPRFVWPDKPSINDANQYYQVAYGLTKEDDLEGVSISVGVMTEGFMNFGWVGALGIMFLLGIFYDFFQKLFLSKESGILWTALGMVLLPQLLAIESQMAQYLGGLIQQVAFTLVIMFPALRLGSKRKALPANVRFGYARK